MATPWLADAGAVRHMRGRWTVEELVAAQKKGAKAHNFVLGTVVMNNSFSADFRCVSHHVFKMEHTYGADHGAQSRS
jgi:hypothetical protein